MHSMHSIPGSFKPCEGLSPLSPPSSSTPVTKIQLPTVKAMATPGPLSGPAAMVATRLHAIDQRARSFDDPSIRPNVDDAERMLRDLYYGASTAKEAQLNGMYIEMCKAMQPSPPPPTPASAVYLDQQVNLVNHMCALPSRTSTWADTSIQAHIRAIAQENASKKSTKTGPQRGPGGKSKRIRKDKGCNIPDMIVLLVAYERILKRGQPHPFIGQEKHILLSLLAEFKITHVLPVPRWFRASDENELVKRRKAFESQLRACVCRGLVYGLGGREHSGTSLLLWGVDHFAVRVLRGPSPRSDVVTYFVEVKEGSELLEGGVATTGMSTSDFLAKYTSSEHMPWVLWNVDNGVNEAAWAAIAAFVRHAYRQLIETNHFEPPFKKLGDFALPKKDQFHRLEMFLQQTDWDRIVADAHPDAKRRGGKGEEQGRDDDDEDKKDDDGRGPPPPPKGHGGSGPTSHGGGSGASPGGGAPPPKPRGGGGPSSYGGGSGASPGGGAPGSAPASGSAGPSAGGGSSGGQHIGRQLSDHFDRLWPHFSRPTSSRRDELNYPSDPSSSSGQSQSDASRLGLEGRRPSYPSSSSATATSDDEAVNKLRPPVLKSTLRETASLDAIRKRAGGRAQAIEEEQEDQEEEAASTGQRTDQPAPQRDESERRKRFHMRSFKDLKKTKSYGQLQSLFRSQPSTEDSTAGDEADETDELFEALKRHSIAIVLVGTTLFEQCLEAWADDHYGARP